MDDLNKRFFQKSFLIIGIALIGIGTLFTVVALTGTAGQFHGVFYQVGTHATEFGIWCLAFALIWFILRKKGANPSLAHPD